MKALPSVELAKKLIAFKTVTGQNAQIKKCLSFCKAYLGSGFYFRTFSFNGVESLYACTGKTLAPKLLVIGHVDVVPAEPEQFKAFVKGGRLFGRGSSDMKGQAACCLNALRNAGKAKSVALLLTSDEETSGENGAKRLAKILKPEFVLSVDISHAAIVTKQKGVIRLVVSAKGKACHGSQPWLGENAIESLLLAFPRIKKLFKKTSVKGENWFPTLNLGIFSGGEAANKVPDKASMTLDIRYTENDNPHEIVQKIRGALKPLKGVNVSVFRFTPNLSIDEADERLLLLKKIFEKNVGKKASFAKEHGAGDQRFFSARDFPVAVFGFDGKNLHGKDEFASIASMKKFEKTLSEFVEKVA
ncbi:MAG: M20/M25/M40 family metallo-hydrolase [Candidatus Diapherotrites archaeon]|nr:M20/M25/M40 family metallo-hydrolase [Candidatus Diapherotrites archaeon]